MINWFGPTSWGAPVCADSPRVPAPVGVACLHCAEPIADGDSGITMPYVGADDTAGVCAYHLNCHLRLIVGSVAHQLRICSCYGGTSTDDDALGMTRRQAADAAAAFFQSTVDGVSYQLIYSASASGDDARAIAIRCGICGSISNNANDVAQRYCGRCHVFHDDRTIAAGGVLPVTPPSVVILQCPFCAWSARNEVDDPAARARIDFYLRRAYVAHVEREHSDERALFDAVPDCICRHCGHRASEHVGDRGACVAAGCECGPGGWT